MPIALKLVMFLKTAKIKQRLLMFLVLVLYFNFEKRIPFGAVVRPGLIGIEMPKLGFIGGTKRIYSNFWKASWSNCVVNPLLYLKLSQKWYSMKSFSMVKFMPAVISFFVLFFLERLIFFLTCALMLQCYELRIDHNKKIEFELCGNSIMFTKSMLRAKLHPK